MFMISIIKYKKGPVRAIRPPYKQNSSKLGLPGLMEASWEGGGALPLLGLG